jgi:hypothetical protein
LLIGPPERPLFCAHGAFTTWSRGSPDFLIWEQLASDGLIRVIETDASGGIGWSFHLTWCSEVVNGGWTSEQQAWHINAKELWVVSECLRQRGHILRGWRALFRVDSTSAEHYVNVRYGRFPHLEALAEEVETAERAAGCVVLAKHMAGRNNVIADAGSRDLAFAARWASDPFRDACLRPCLFQAIQRDLGKFDLDLFADREGLGALAPRWRYAQRSACEADLKGQLVWAHPPRELIPGFIKWVSEEQKRVGPLRVALLAPCDSGAPWFRASSLRAWTRRQSWPAGSDLFRWVSDTPRADGSVCFRKV